MINMGKNLIQQARGKGGPTYRSPSHRFRGWAKHNMNGDSTLKGFVVDLIDCPGHSAPLAHARYENGEECLLLAPEGLKVGKELMSGNEAAISTGNILPLKNIPKGTSIYNIESQPGDGGKFVRSSGVTAKLISKSEKKAIVQLPSKKKKEFDLKCRACIGILAGGGRVDKPFVKAGNKFHAMKAKNKLYPSVSAGSMNAVDHPFGNSRSLRKSKAKPVSRNAPPGRKVGMISPRRTGRAKGKK